MQRPRQQPARPVEPAPLDQVARAAAECGLCRLCQNRTRVVFGNGSTRARVMFVTEGPGYHEDRSGIPLVGPAGELFASLLGDIGMRREDVYVTGVIKCRPPRNRSPFPDEIESCEGYLFQQVMSVQPAVICALGNVSIRLLTGRPHSLSNVHGQPFDGAVGGRGVTIYPLYHPGAAVVSPALIETLRRDFRRIPELLRLAEQRELAPSAAADAAGAAVSAPSAPAPPAVPADSVEPISEPVREGADKQLSLLG